jgi:cell wall-associated NlpC family hydrolase
MAPPPPARPTTARCGACRPRRPRRQGRGRVDQGQARAGAATRSPTRPDREHLRGAAAAARAPRPHHAGPDRQGDHRRRQHDVPGLDRDGRHRGRATRTRPPTPPRRPSDRAAAARADAAALAGEAKAARAAPRPPPTTQPPRRAGSPSSAAARQPSSPTSSTSPSTSPRSARRRSKSSAAGRQPPPARVPRPKHGRRRRRPPRPLLRRLPREGSAGSSQGQRRLLPAPVAGPRACPAGLVRRRRGRHRFAQAQLGEWYLWGAAGPDRWDCSGLTMMAFRQAGIYLPHFSGAQYDAGTPIPVTPRSAGTCSSGPATAARRASTTSRSTSATTRSSRRRTPAPRSGSVRWTTGTRTSPSASEPARTGRRAGVSLRVWLG